MFSSVFKKSFDSVKCNTLLRLTTARIKLLRNKRDVHLKQLKRDLAKLLETKQEPRAHIQVENIHREQNIMAAYDIIELLCDLLAARMPILVSQRQCPTDLREAVASIIYAAPRCADIPELQEIRRLFTSKYGKEFTAVAAELRPDCGVNRVIIEKLSVRKPTIETKLKLMKDIATEQGLDWDPKELASQNLNSPEDLLDGPSQFFEASQMSVQDSFKEPSIHKPISPQQQNGVAAESKEPVVQTMDFVDEKQFIPFVRPIVQENVSSSGSASNPRRPPVVARRQNSRSCDISSHNLSEDCLSHNLSTTAPHSNGDDDDSQWMLKRKTSSRSVASFARYSHIRNEDESQYRALDRRTSLKDAADAARAAAESAEHAAAAARAAALLAIKRRDMNMERLSSESESDDDGDEASQHSERSEDGRLRPNDSSTLRMPVFDEEAADGEGSPRMPPQSGEKQYDSREELSVSYSIFDTDTHSQATANLGRHTDGQQVDQSGLDSSNSLSKHYRGESNDANLSRNGSFAAAGAASKFDTSEWGTQLEDEAAQSRPPKRPPPRVPAQHPTVTKSPTFVHPKLPDSDELIAHFQALKAMKSKT